MNFTFYLFKKEVETPEQAFREGKLNATDGYVRLSPTNLPLPYPCDAYIQYASPTTPTWVKPLLNHFQIDKAKAKNFSNSLVLLIPVEGRLFGVTYGYGFTAINRALVEKDFGKKVAANEVDPENLRQLNSRDLDTSTRQTSVITNRPSTIHDYKFRTNSDLLTLVAGIPANKEYARRISGATSLTATMDIDIKDLGNKCKELLDSYNKKEYQKAFGFIDRIAIVENEQLLTVLQSDLENTLIKGQKENIYFAYPNGNFKPEEIAYFILTCKGESEKIDGIEGLSMIDSLKSLVKPPVTIEEVKVTAFDDNDNMIIGEASLLDYIVYETQIRSSNYILMDGSWYQIDRDFYNEVNEFALEVEEIDDPTFLPAMQASMDEGDYSEYSCKDKGYILFDKKLHYFGGYDKVEVCDLLTPKFEFICVKPYSGSATLSHLFSQGSVSGQLLTNHPDYKKTVEKQIVTSGIDFGSIFEKENRDITFVYAIATEKKGKLVQTLPFFSKLTLLEARQVLQGLGYKVKVFKIPIEV